MLNLLLMAVRLEVKSLTDTNTLLLLEPSLAALPAPLLCSLVCFPGPIQMLPLCDAGARVAGHPSPCSTAVCLRNQETSKICRVTVAVKSDPFLQLPLAAAINLAEETGVMFESNFVSSFINQVGAEWLSPGGELCKQHEGFALLLGGIKWGKRR